MLVLVINCGSSSLKYQLYRMPDRVALARGLVEKIGSGGSGLTHRRGDESHPLACPIPDHREAARLALEALACPKRGVLGHVREIGAVGHRVVHGGEAYSGSVRIDSQVTRAIEEMGDLAPLHNPANLTGIRAVEAALPGVPMAAVFDTAFHQTLPPKAYLYPVRYDVYTRHRVRKYGFHGSSHQYVAGRAAKILGLPPSEANLIVCHLGNGASVTAVRGGRSVDTTMGFTPLAGLMMGTRCGDIDPAIPLYLQSRPEFGGSAAAVDALLNKESGLLGISGRTNDMRDLHAAAAREGPDSRPALALEMFAYRVKGFVGMYSAVLGRVDAVVFTAGIGENDHAIRLRSLSDLGDALGIEIDPALNARAVGGREGDIATAGSRVRVLVVPTDEEGFIASEAYRLCRTGT